VHAKTTNYAKSCRYDLNGVLFFAYEVPKNNTNATTSMLATATTAAPTTGLYLMGTFCTLLLVSAHYRCSILTWVKNNKRGPAMFMARKRSNTIILFWK